VQLPLIGIPLIGSKVIVTKVKWLTPAKFAAAKSKMPELKQRLMCTGEIKDVGHYA
jgi:hypothetical protein